MPKLKKLLSKFNKEERKEIQLLVESIISLKWSGSDVKKLKGHENIFRIRKGKIRIIFSKEKREILILAIERRSDTTYKF
jgi:mRNA-degrading endonuclease RelE of RelBE toxin-antitoxin system